MINNRTLAITALAIALGTLSWACDAKPPFTPTSPVASPTFTLSGLISEDTPTGHATVSGARVQVGTRETRSGLDGRYSVSGVAAGTLTVSTSKDGFETDTRTITIAADTLLDILVARIPTYTLSGVVSELTTEGPVPLEGVDVYWSEYKGTFTDGKGFYTIEGLYKGVQPMWVAKEGYTFAVDIPHPMGERWRDVTISGDTRFDVQLVRR
jgi:hypothetical protein